MVFDFQSIENGYFTGKVFDSKELGVYFWHVPRLLDLFFGGSLLWGCALGERPLGRFGEFVGRSPRACALPLRGPPGEDLTDAADGVGSVHLNQV